MGQERTLLELHLDDQTDSKTLVGAYVCSDVPGEFVWQAGVVTQAALKGHWLVIEDIDRVPLEVIAALSPLLERRKLYLPVRGVEVPVHPSFRIFGTRTIATSQLDASEGDIRMAAYNRAAGMTSPTLRHFSHFWLFVNISVPTQEEIEGILHSRFPGLLPIVKQKLVETYALFKRTGTGGGRGTKSGSSKKKEAATAASEGKSSDMIEGDDNDEKKEKETATASTLAPYIRESRQFTLRDLMKAAARAERFSDDFNHGSGYLTDAQRRDLVAEVVDVFAAASRHEELHTRLAHQLGAAWDVPEAEVEAFILNANPQYEVHQDRVVVGRGVLGFAPSDELIGHGEGQQFAFTKHSLRLLERVAVCAGRD